MAWYNPLTRFKNTPSNITTPTDNQGNAVNEQSQTQSGTQSQGTSVTQGEPIVTQPTTAPKLNWFDRVLNTLLPITNKEGMDVISAAESKSIYNQNKDKTKFETEGFSLDPYNTVQGIELQDSPIDHTVNTEKNEGQKWFDIIGKAILPKVSKMIKGEDVELGTMGDALNIARNYINEEMNIGLEIESVDWGDIFTKNLNEKPLSFSTKIFYGDSDIESPVRIAYNNPNKIELQYDLGIYKQYEDAYKQGAIGEVTWENTKDAFYNKYKDGFGIQGQTIKTKNSAFSGDTINKDFFFEFVDGEVAKQSALEEKSDESTIMKIFQDEKAESRLAQATQYSRSIIGEAVNKSLIRTVEARQEFMNDTESIITDTIGRWNNVMYGAYWTKAHLQRLYDTTDLSKANLTPEHQVIYDDIVWGEKAYDQFIKNLTQWISLMPDYVNPETGKLDRMPDAIVDPDSGEMMSYHQFLFKGVDMDDNRWLPSVTNASQSPQDVLDYNSRFIRLRSENLEDGFLERAWNRFQYGGAVGVGTPLNELSQQTMGRVFTFGQDLLSRESGEVPFEFTNMDSSLMASLTTNKSNFGRLIQNFNIKTNEYVPELVGQVGFNLYLGKSLNNLGELAQIRTLGLANKIPWAKTVGGQQFAQTISYAPRVLQLLGTDQTIDAIASIGDTESLSDFSKWLSIGGTFLGEGIGIMRDLKVLGKSILKNFDKSSKLYGGLTDPIRLIAENDGILDNYAAQIGRGAVDESGKIVGDQYKLLLQDLNQYAKGLKKMSDSITQAVKAAEERGVDLSRLNQDTKQAAYNVLKQVFNQDSAMAKVVTNMLTDQRVNIADMVKYIGGLDGAVKVGPWVSTIKMTDNMGQTFAQRTVRNYDEGMDLIVEGGLVRGINEGLTKTEIDELFAQGFIKENVAKDIENNLGEYFNMVNDGETIKFYPTEKGLQALGIDSSVVSSPLAIVSMSDDTRKLIDKLKSMPNKKLNDNLLEQIGETNAINTLARNIADIDILDICK